MAALIIIRTLAATATTVPSQSRFWAGILGWQTKYGYACPGKDLLSETVDYRDAGKRFAGL